MEGTESVGEAGQDEGTRAFPRRNPQGAPPGRRSGDGARTASDETRSKGYRRALKQPTSAREESGRKERTMSEREALVMEGTLFAQDPDGTPEEKREAPGAPDNELVFEGWGSRRLRDAMRIAMTIVRTRTKVTGCRLVSRRDDRDALVFASDSHRLAQVRISEVSRSTKSAGLDLALPAQAVKALAQGVPGPRVRIGAENGHAVIEHAESDETTVYPNAEALGVEVFDSS